MARTAVAPLAGTHIALGLPVLAGRADLNEKEFFGRLDPQTRAIIVSTLCEIVRRHALRAGPTD